MSAIESALAYAAQLDALLASPISDEVEETMVFRVGELLGGLGFKGFAADLAAEMQRIEDREMEGEDAEGYTDRVRQLFWPSPRTVERVDRLRDEAAMRWEREARALMAPHAIPTRRAA